MTMESLIVQLNNYNPQNDYERALQQRVTEFVTSDPNCLSRDNFYGHVTGSAWVIDEHGEKALLTLHRKLSLWLQPGGHVDGDADVLAVAMREVAEEAGLTDLKSIGGIFDIAVHHNPAFGNEPAHYHFDIRYLLQLQSPQPLVMSHESLDLAWYHPNEIADLLTDDSVKRLCAKWQTMCGVL